MVPQLENTYDFKEVQTFKRWMSKFHDNLRFSSHVIVVSKQWKNQVCEVATHVLDL